jgi:NAD(P)H-dependent flavin oxidoreductase YrpB (nitropropane dioxygenase family)
VTRNRICGLPDIGYPILQGGMLWLATAEPAALEKSHLVVDNIETLVGGSLARKAKLDGNLTDGDAYSGLSAGLIREILPAAVVVENLVKECEVTILRMHHFPMWRTR